MNSVAIVCLLFVLAISSGSQGSRADKLENEPPGKWRASSGNWHEERGGIRGSGYLDNRLILEKQAPVSFEWKVEMKLLEGTSAGTLFWASGDGAKAFTVRLDSRNGELILAELDAWPHEKRLAVSPWTLLNGSSAKIRILAGKGEIRVYCDAVSNYPLLQADHLKPAGDRIGCYLIDASATFNLSEPVEAQAETSQKFVPAVGEFKQIYHSSAGEKEPWYINDHCFIHGQDGWHIFGITHAHPASPMEEKNFAHATSPSLITVPFTKQPYALRTDNSLGENHLWAPHVIKRKDTYYMYYCAGSRQSNFHYRIHLATSKDLKTWTKAANNPVLEDFYDARDPMVFEDKGTYYLYYTANFDRENMHHVVNVRTSKDLLHWSSARTALIHPEIGTYGGPTESPFVVKIGEYFYLFCGPDGDYHRTVVYRSPNPLHWEHSSQIASFPSHACEVVQDTDGKWYASNAGWDLEGVFLAPLTWNKAD